MMRTSVSSSCFLLSLTWVSPQIAHAVVLGNLPLCVRLPYRLIRTGQGVKRGIYEKACRSSAGLMRAHCFHHSYYNPTQPEDHPVGHPDLSPLYRLPILGCHDVDYRPGNGHSDASQQRLAHDDFANQRPFFTGWPDHHLYGISCWPE